MFNSFTQYLVDKQIKGRYKIGTFVFVLFIVLLLNDVMGFTFYYNNHKKLEELELITQLKNAENLTEESIEHILRLEKDINKRQSVFSIFWNFILSIKDTNFEFNAAETGTNSEETPLVEEIAPRNNLTLYLCSSWFFIFVVLLLIFVVIQSRIKKTSTTGIKEDIWGLIAVFMAAGLLSLLFYYLFGLIPMIGGSWFWSYTFAASFQFVLFVLILYVAYKSGRK